MSVLRREAEYGWIIGEAQAQLIENESLVLRMPIFRPRPVLNELEPLHGNSLVVELAEAERSCDLDMLHLAIEIVAVVVRL